METKEQLREDLDEFLRMYYRYRRFAESYIKELERFNIIYIILLLINLINLINLIMLIIMSVIR